MTGAFRTPQHAIAEAGVAGKQVSPVDAFCWAVEELLRCTERGVLLAVDNYAALYGHTGYGEWVSFKERKAIPPESLRAAVALRVLTRRPPKRGGERGGAISSAPLDSGRMC